MCRHAPSDAPPPPPPPPTCRNGGVGARRSGLAAAEPSAELPLSVFFAAFFAGALPIVESAA
jgi:hypothetical protein